MLDISRRQADPGQDRRRRSRPAGALPRFNNYTFLKEAEKRNQYRRAAVGEGARLAGRALPEPQRRRPGLAQAAARRALPPRAVARRSTATRSTRWSSSGWPRKRQHGAAAEPAVPAGVPHRLDEVRRQGGQRAARRARPDERDADGLRLLPDGRPVEIVVETAGESTEETDVLELIRDNWRKIGIALFSRPSQREVFRNRVFAGEIDDVGLVGHRQRRSDRRHEPGRARADRAGAAAMADVGPVLRARTARAAKRPTCRRCRSWSSCSTNGATRRAPTSATKIWQRDAGDLHRPGVLDRHRHAARCSRSSSRQRCATSREGLYSWDPGAYFGIYQPDTFWFDTAGAPTDAALHPLAHRC